LTSFLSEIHSIRANLIFESSRLLEQSHYNSFPQHTFIELGTIKLLENALLMPPRKQIDKGKGRAEQELDPIKIKIEPSASSASDLPTIKAGSLSEPPLQTDSSLIMDQPARADSPLVKDSPTDTVPSTMMNRPDSAGPQAGASPTPATGGLAGTPLRPIQPAPSPAGPLNPLPSSFLLPSPGNYKHNNWEAILPHTAKCDFCSNHNTRVMQRCIACNHQVCQNCIGQLDQNKHVVDVDKFIWDPVLVPKKTKAQKNKKPAGRNASSTVTAGSSSDHLLATSHAARVLAHNSISATNHTLRALAPRRQGHVTGERLLTEEEKRGWYVPESSARPSSSQGMDPSSATSKRRYEVDAAYTPKKGESSGSQEDEGAKRLRALPARAATRREYSYDDNDSDATEYAPMTEEYAAKHSQRADLGLFSGKGSASGSRQGAGSADDDREVEMMRQAIQNGQRYSLRVARSNTPQAPDQNDGRRINAPALYQNRAPPPGFELNAIHEEFHPKQEQYHIPRRESHLPTRAEGFAPAFVTNSAAPGSSFGFDYKTIFDEAAKKIADDKKIAAEKAKRENDAKLADLERDMEYHWNNNEILVKMRGEGREDEAREIWECGKVLAAIQASITLPKGEPETKS
jgi:hypothetical protein